jgi:bifunctional aspartokinase / homoserine dehydrogenase 1
VALANAGFRVEVICPPRHPVGQTRAAARTHTYQGLTPLHSLARAIAAAKPDLAVPGDDLAVRHLHELYRRRELFSGGTADIESLIERSLGSPEAFQIVRGRAAFMMLARAEGIRVPETEAIKTAEDLKSWIERVGFPTVLKADGTSGGEGVRMVRAAAEAQPAFQKLQATPLLARAFKRALVNQDRTLIWPSLLRHRPTVNAQAFVAGHEATSTIACWKGTVLASLHFEVLRKCNAAGHATVVRLIENAEMQTAVEKVVRRMGLSGLCGFDFMLETGTGNAYLIEINPRATQVGHIALGAGHDLPAALYGAITGHPVRVAPAVTANDTIVLFPHEWARDPRSDFLRTAYHDVPWDTPDLVHACIQRSRKQSKWYSRADRSGIAVAAPPVKVPAEQRFRASAPTEIQSGNQSMTRVEHKIDETTAKMKKPLQVMKFGGTSVGDASCIARVVDIVRNASREFDIAVVVSAMSGVTNRLIEAANQSKAGNKSAVAEMFTQLGKHHDDVVEALIHSATERKCLQSKLHDLLAEGERLCQGTILSRELTPRTLDAISGLGERLCAPLVAAALSEVGVASESIEATELVVTDSYHGGAEPWIDMTRGRCRVRVAPLLQKGMVPVVTGFIGATEEGVLTTLGRGGSDYSATILGAALDADEVVIWSDVTGLLTADPKLVAGACTIPEISYREAGELAYFGAKVLHPKTLRPVMQSGIPVWIRNTFAADEPGTKITPAGTRNAGGAMALTAIRDAALIRIRIAGRTQGGTQGAPDALARTVASAAAVRTDVLLISQSTSHKDICLAVASTGAERTVEALRHEFSGELLHQKAETDVLASPVSVITLVGQNMRTASGAFARAFAALEQENVEILATAQGSSECSMSFLVPQQQMKSAIASLHRELELGNLQSNGRPAKGVGVTAEASPSAIWKCQSEPASAD